MDSRLSWKLGRRVAPLRAPPIKLLMEKGKNSKALRCIFLQKLVALSPPPTTTIFRGSLPCSRGGHFIYLVLLLLFYFTFFFFFFFFIRAFYLCGKTPRIREMRRRRLN
jgi:hypothetical protein